MIAFFTFTVAQAVTWTVDTASDTSTSADGLTSLREALAAATSGDDIVFGFTSQQTIALSASQGALPALPTGVLLDGQQLALLDATNLANGPGLSLSANATVLGMSIKSSPGACIEITGDGARVGDAGSTDRNYLWDCGRSGILVDTNAGSAVIENNVIGANSTGSLSGVCDSPGSNACAGIYHRSSDSPANTIDSNYIVATKGTPSLA